MQYKGSCHCGRIAFEVEGELQNVLACNCSICSRRGHLLWFVPRDKFRLLTPASDYSTYRFRTMTIAHNFCPVCGCGPFGEGVDPKGNAMAAVNARCLEGVDLDALKVVPFDGRSM